MNIPLKDNGCFAFINLNIKIAELILIMFFFFLEFQVSERVDLCVQHNPYLLELAELFSAE